jgi:Predicted transcriptional regulators
MRKAYKLTQIQLAEKAGIAVNSLRRYESNERQPSSDVIQQLAAAVGISDVEFFMRFPRGLEDMSPVEIASLIKAGEVLLDESGKPYWDMKGAVDGSVLDEDIRQNDILTHFKKLNEKGQQKAVEQVEDLAKIPDYQKK